jgi:ADP-heptose:LPS heptosyltransferase
LTEDQLSPPVIPRNTGRQFIGLRSGPAGIDLAQFDTRPSPRAALKILVIKLDHLGDFLIGLPALQQLRSVFSESHVTLICGSWNAAIARGLGAADEVRCFDYFPENAQDWDGQIAKKVVAGFREACAGTFDIAIDLRVDEDTRPLLRHVEASLRCGIGSRLQHPYLDVILPREFERRDTALPGSHAFEIRPDGFHSRMPTQTPFYHETNFSITNTHLIYGPYCQLPLGRLRAELVYQMTAPAFWWPRVRMTIDVIRDDQSKPVAVVEVPCLPQSRLCRFEVAFSNDNPAARYEVRSFVRGRPWFTRLRFFGMRVEVIDAPQARYRSAELHIGESLSLLVRLIAERVRPLYRPNLADQVASGDGTAPRSLEGLPAAAKYIVIAPFSNSLLRNWSIERYARLIRLLMAEVDSYILLAGSPEQAPPLTALCRGFGNDPRLLSLAGRVDWTGLVAVVRDADLVIANNSGVAHLAAACGTPTLAIYSGSHQPQEWGPRGQSVRALMAAVPCSPCGHDKLEECSYDHRCMTSIEPEFVLAHALELLRREGRSVTEAADATLVSP